MGCGASSRTAHCEEEELRTTSSRAQSPTAAVERAALRSARSSARAHGSSGSAGCGAECLPASRTEKRKSSAPHRAEHPSPRRQQSVPHSGVREALLAPTAAPALPDAVRSVFSHSPPRRGRAPHHMEQSSISPGGSRACRTPDHAGPRSTSMRNGRPRRRAVRVRSMTWPTNCSGISTSECLGNKVILPRQPSGNPASR